MEKEIINFRGFKKVYMVTVCEGQGTEESPLREVKYIYDDDREQFIGKIDPISKDNLQDKEN